MGLKSGGRGAYAWLLPVTVVTLLHVGNLHAVALGEGP